MHLTDSELRQISIEINNVGKWLDYPVGSFKKENRGDRQPSIGLVKYYGKADTNVEVGPGFTVHGYGETVQRIGNVLSANTRGRKEKEVLPEFCSAYQIPNNNFTLYVGKNKGESTTKFLLSIRGSLSVKISRDPLDDIYLRPGQYVKISLTNSCFISPTESDGSTFLVYGARN